MQQPVIQHLVAPLVGNPHRRSEHLPNGALFLSTVSTRARARTTKFLGNILQGVNERPKDD